MNLYCEIAFWMARIFIGAAILVMVYFHGVLLWEHFTKTRSDGECPAAGPLRPERRVGPADRRIRPWPRRA